MMPSTGLYFLPHSSSSTTTEDSSPLRDFLARLTATYNVTPLQRWTLEHRIFRETTPRAAPSTTDRTSSTSFFVKYLQVLTLSHEPGLSYIAITNTLNNTIPPAASSSSSSSSLPSLPSLPSSQKQQAVARIGGVADPSTADSSSSSNSIIDNNGAEAAAATIASINSGQATDDFVQFLATKLAPLWTLLKMVSVPNGLAYEVGDFRIRAGELRQQGVGSSQVPRGIVVEINWVGGGGGGGGAEDGDRMEEEVEGVIKGFWEPLGISGAKELFQVAGFAEGNGTVRQWVEMLRLRG